MTLDRRQFLKVTGAQAGLALVAPALAGMAPAVSRRSSQIIVVGAGAFGGWTAYWLRQMGATVTVVDAYGPGNSRATSGDETRGIRSSYGTSSNVELWMPWANEAISRWMKFDEEWGREMKVRLFFNSGDLIMRAAPEPIIQRNIQMWTKFGIPHEKLNPEEVAYRYPGMDIRDIREVIYEPRAGIVRAKRSCEVVAEAFRQAGGEVLMGYASLGDRDGNRLQNIKTSGPAATLSAETYVFALGPWFPKAMPDVMGQKLRTPLGHVHYFGTPPGDDRFTFPNLPSYNFPGVTGWPALPTDSRGFRVRMRGNPDLTDPDLSQRAFERKKDKDARNLLKQRFPMLRDQPLLETRACHYETSATGNWIIDRHPAFDNVWIAGGGSAEGFKFGPVLGEYIAKRVLGTDDDPALAANTALNRRPQQTAAQQRGEEE